MYHKIIEEVYDDYDLILIDCPPALGQSVAAATLASNIVIAPVTPEQFSLSGLKISFDEISSLSNKFDRKIDFKIVVNKFDTRTAISKEVLTTILNDDLFKSLTCNTFIRHCQDFPNSIIIKSNIFASLKRSVAKEDIDIFTQEILGLSELEKNV